MKNFTLIIAFILASGTCFSQENKSYVEVRGLAKYQRTALKYQAIMDISPNAAGYYAYEDEKPKLEEITAQVFEKLEELGFDKNQFEKNDTKNYQQSTHERVYYTFETTSEEKYIKFTTMKPLKGTYITEKKVFLKPMENREELIAKAIKDARENAVVVAKAMGKPLGDILSVTDYGDSTFEKDFTYYPMPEESTYGLSVRFAVE